MAIPSVSIFHIKTLKVKYNLKKTEVLNILLYFLTMQMITSNQKVSRQHALYGEYTINKWYSPIITHKYINSEHFVCDNDNFELMVNDDDNCVIRRKNSNKNLTPNPNYCVTLYRTNRDKPTFSMTHIILKTLFPDVDPLYTVDHINDNPNDNSVLNLQWMTLKDNARKGAQKSNFIRRKGKKVEVICEDGTCITFESVTEASQWIYNQLKLKPHDKLISFKSLDSKVRLCISNPSTRYSTYGFKIRQVEEIDDEEHFKPFPYPTLIDYEVSDKGRIRNKYGNISKGSGCEGRNKKYRVYKVIISKKGDNNYISKTFYVHQMVWLTFNGNLPAKGNVIMHDDKVPLDQDGYYRNYLCDLKMGTQSENMKSYHENKNNEEIASVTIENTDGTEVIENLKHHRVYKDRKQTDVWKESIIVAQVARRVTSDEVIMKVKEELAKKTKTHQTIANELGIGRGTVSNISNGKMDVASKSTIESMNKRKKLLQESKDLTIKIKNAGYTSQQVGGIKVAIQKRILSPNEIIDILEYKIANKSLKNNEIAHHFSNVFGKEISKDIVFNVSSLKGKTKIYAFEFPINNVTYEHYLKYINA